VQEGPKPEWAVTLDKMRDYHGNERSEAVTLTAAEAIAFVRHYLATSAALDEAEKALRAIADPSLRHHGKYRLGYELAREALARMEEK